MPIKIRPTTMATARATFGPRLFDFLWEGSPIEGDVEGEDGGEEADTVVNFTEDAVDAALTLKEL